MPHFYDVSADFSSSIELLKKKDGLKNCPLFVVFGMLFNIDWTRLEWTNNCPFFMCFRLDWIIYFILYLAYTS